MLLTGVATPQTRNTHPRWSMPPPVRQQAQRQRLARGSRTPSTATARPGAKCLTVRRTHPCTSSSSPETLRRPQPGTTPRRQQQLQMVTVPGRRRQPAGSCRPLGPPTWSTRPSAATRAARWTGRSPAARRRPTRAALGGRSRRAARTVPRSSPLHDRRSSQAAQRGGALPRSSQLQSRPREAAALRGGTPVLGPRWSGRGARPAP